MKSIFVICMCFSSIWAEKEIIPVQKQLSGRIVEGEVANDGQFPWEVAVNIEKTEETLFCGGALIAPDWVLTAAHCIYEATNFTLRMGSNLLVGDDVKRVTISAVQFEIYSGFVPDTLENDIGLIRITSPYVTNDHIHIIRLSDTFLESNVSVTVSGWGSTADGGNDENELRYVTLKTITNEECLTFYNDAIKDGMVCAVGEDTAGPCEGDSGSPLISENDDGKVRLVGIASFVSTNGCETGHPSGYTRVASYLEWIRDVTSAA